MLLFPQLPTFKFDNLVITPYVEARERVQRRTDKGFSDHLKDNSSLFESRYRLGFSVTDNKRFSGRVIYQYGLTQQWTAARNSSFQGSDLYVAEGDLKLDKKGDTLKFGRQIIAKGGQRLFEESFFGQRSKSYDALRVTGKNYDVFAGKVGYGPVADDKARLAAASYDWPQSLGETMVAYKYDRWRTHENFFTFDHRYVGTFGQGRRKVNLELEGAYETGRYGGKDLSAWFLHGRLGNSVDKAWGTFVEGNVYSGGNSATKTNDFDNLYGATHDWLGRMDVVGPRNIENICVAAAYKGIPKVQLEVSYDHFWLTNASDALYSTGLGVYSVGGHKAVDPTGQSGRDVGQEEDLVARYDVNKNLWFGAEMGLFQPGPFIRKIVGSGNNNQLWGMIYVNVRFP